MKSSILTIGILFIISCAHSLSGAISFSLITFNSTSLELILTDGGSLNGPLPPANSSVLTLFGFKDDNLVSNWISGTGTVGAFTLDNGTRNSTASSVFITTHFSNDYIAINSSTSDTFINLPTDGILSGTPAQRSVSVSGTIDTSAIDELRLIWGTGSTSGTAADGTFQSAVSVPEAAHFTQVAAGIALLFALLRRRSLKTVS